MIVRSCKWLVPLGRFSFLNIMNRFRLFALVCKLISRCWFETCGVSWWLTIGTCDSILIFCFVTICCWFVTSYCYRAFVFGTPTGFASSNRFIYLSCVGTFSITVSFNCLLMPFISTLDIHYFVIQQAFLSSWKSKLTPFIDETIK
jgi:hypothetical protein